MASASISCKQEIAIMWYVIVGVVCLFIGFLMSRSAIEHALKKEGYIIITDMKKESGRGRYKIIDVSKNPSFRR